MRVLLVLTASVLIITGCSDKAPIPYCERQFDPITCEYVSGIKYDIFEMCLDKLSKMRSSSGGNYTTHDDEDLDEAITACRHSSSPYRNYQQDCEPNPAFVAQKEFCNEP